MTVETASFIAELNSNWPLPGDYKKEGDDHLRLVKDVLQSQFPNFEAAAVLPTVAEINEFPNDIAALDARIAALEQDGGGFRIGDIMWSGSANVPSSWLECDGTSLDTTTYADLFAAIGYAYGGSGAVFSLPDLRAHFPLGRNPAGAGGLSVRDLGDTGGAETHLLTGAESGTGVHDHPVQLENSGATNNVGVRFDPFQDSGDGELVIPKVGTKVPPSGHTGATGDNAEADASAAHNNLPPYLTLAAFIKAL